jgi:hypothetical protein
MIRLRALGPDDHDTPHIARELWRFKAALRRAGLDVEDAAQHARVALTTATNRHPDKVLHVGYRRMVIRQALQELFRTSPGGYRRSGARLTYQPEAPKQIWVGLDPPAPLTPRRDPILWATIERVCTPAQASALRAYAESDLEPKAFAAAYGFSRQAFYDLVKRAKRRLAPALQMC